MIGAPDGKKTRPNPSSVISRLEGELRDLWKVPEDPGGTPLTRVCTMNIEVVAPTTELLERYTPVIDEVLANVPARAILAAIEPERSEDELDGSATAVCWLENGRKICSERITLTCRGNAAARAASAIETFLVPEIPAALVWLGRVHTNDPVFEDLANDVHRIILDSEYSSLANVIQVVAWAREQRVAPEIADLAWTRIATWQEMLARFFDGGETRDLAGKVTRVVLKQAGDPGARIGPEAALMLGWIATRLGWKSTRLAAAPPSPQATPWPQAPPWPPALRLTRPDGANVVVELASVPRPEGVAPHTLAALVIEAGDDPAAPALRGSIERQLGSGLADRTDTTVDADVIAWTCARADAPAFEQRVRLSANKAARWLEHTLRRPARDVAFTESIAFAEHIVEDGLIVA